MIHSEKVVFVAKSILTNKSLALWDLLTKMPLIWVKSCWIELNLINIKLFQLFSVRFLYSGPAHRLCHKISCTMWSVRRLRWFLVQYEQIQCLKQTQSSKKDSNMKYFQQEIFEKEIHGPRHFICSSKCRDEIFVENKLTFIQ